MKIDFKTQNYAVFGNTYKNQNTQNTPYYAKEGYAQCYQPVPVVRKHQSGKVRIVSGSRSEAEQWARNIVAFLLAFTSLLSVSIINRNTQKNNTENPVSTTAITGYREGKEEDEPLNESLDMNARNVLKRSVIVQRGYEEETKGTTYETTTKGTTGGTYEVIFTTTAKPPVITYEAGEVEVASEEATIPTSAETIYKEAPITGLFEEVLPETEKESAPTEAQTTTTLTEPTEVAETTTGTIYEEPDEEIYYEDGSSATQTEAQNNVPILIAPQEIEVQTEPTAVDNKEVSAAEPTQAEKNMYSKGQEYLLNLEYAGGDAWKYFDDFASQLNMSKEEAMEYLVNLCESENFGNGTIDPIILCAQIYQESSYDNNCIGDHGKAVGFGQLHPEALEEVNIQLERNYQLDLENGIDDRKDPKKNLEMMVLFMRYCRERVEKKYEGESAKFHIKASLAMYSRGHATGINETGGQNYVDAVLKHLDNHWVK